MRYLHNTLSEVFEAYKAPFEQSQDFDWDEWARRADMALQDSSDVSALLGEIRPLLKGLLDEKWGPKWPDADKVFGAAVFKRLCNLIDD